MSNTNLEYPELADLDLDRYEAKYYRDAFPLDAHLLLLSG